MTIAWKNRQNIVVRDGLKSGDLVVTSPLAVAIEGMAVSTTDREAEADE